MQLIKQIARVNDRLQLGVDLDNARYEPAALHVKTGAETAIVTLETEERVTPDDRYDLHLIQLFTGTTFADAKQQRGRSRVYAEKHTVTAIVYAKTLYSIEAIKKELSKLAEVKLLKAEYSPEAINSQYLKLQKQATTAEHYLAAFTYELTGAIGC